MKLPSLGTTLAALLFSGVVSLPFLPGINREREYFALEARMQASTTGQAQLFFDGGAGYRESASVRVPVEYSPEAVDYRFAIPAGAYRSFRFDPFASDGTVTIESMRVIDATGTLVRALPLEAFRANDHFASITVADGTLRGTVRPGANDPQLIIHFEPPLELSLPWLGSLRSPLWAPLLVLAGVSLILYLVPRFAAGRTAVPQFQAWARSRPARAVLLFAGIAVIASSYPVVFCGKSFVSPNFSDGSVLLYGRFPTLPGYEDAKVENAMGSDVGAIAWHHSPLSIVEHRALFDDGELPLWNRYNATGSPLLGQGQSMFGDFLHLLPLAAEGASWSWDIKYLLAKWLFCVGLGLTVLHATRFLPAALITAFSAAFIGFFVYRVNHPAFFSMCYAPWILYAWLRIQSASAPRAFVPWIGVLMLANWVEMNSGTVKEAYMLLMALNVTGCALCFAARGPWTEKRAKLGWLVAAGFSFVLLAAPIWLTFLDTLAVSYTAYDNPAANQIDPSLALGLFDEIFYRPVNTNERVFNPSANFLVLIGVLYVAATFRRAPHDRTKTILTVAALPSLALAFGFFPPEWIVQIPFLRNVVHVDNTFSCVLIIHLLVLAGFGYKLAAERLASAEGRGDLIVVAVLLIALIFPWLALTHTVLKAAFGPNAVFRMLADGQHLPVSNFVWGSLVLLPIAGMTVLVLTWRALQRRSWTRATLLVMAACIVVLLWRHGQHLRYGFSTYVYNPGPRVDLLAPSEAVERIRADDQDAQRVVGVYDNLVPGWSAAYGLETIAGPDALQNPHYRELTLGLGLRMLWGWRIFVRPEEIDTLKACYDFLNVRYYFDLPGGPDRPYSSLESVARLDLDVFASATPWPRAFFTDRIVRYDAVRDLGHLIRNGDGRPFAAIERTSNVQLSQLGDELADRAVVPARNYHLTNNTTSFEIVAPSAGVVVLHEAWVPENFRVSINGRAADYFRVNHAFKGVVLSRPGTYTIEFSYRPRRFTLSLFLSAGGFVLVVAGGIVAKRPAPAA